MLLRRTTASRLGASDGTEPSGRTFWVDPKEKVVGVLMVQTDNPIRQLDRDFESAVMQAIVE